MLADSPQEVINRQSSQKSLSVAQFLWKMQGHIRAVEGRKVKADTITGTG